ncbi:MAG: EAL domain-containing protein [Deinococcus-Thermus bacterium]|jgi:diguanylate cyclase (GGDEF)-like protein|nr:EAL domain-containing protein [Deinococcota bacterium]
MNRWRRLLPALLAPALLVAALVWPAAPFWAAGLMALVSSAAVARGMGWSAGVMATLAGGIAVGRPWEATEPAGVMLGLDPILAGALATALVAGGWIGVLERSLGSQLEASDQARYDPLTGLLTRPAFEERMTQTIGETRERGDGLALLFVDLDRFKVVNDTYGHAVGDGLLRRIASLLRGHVRQADVVGRLGGDEFVIALRGLREPDSAAAVAKKLLEVLNEPHEVAGRHVEVGASIGVALFPHDGEDVRTLVKSADHAMYQVKEGGRNAIGFTTIETKVAGDRRRELERQLRSALHEDEFELHYQPTFDLSSGTPTGVELLLRWRNAQLGVVPPDEFVPMAEETGVILPLGRWILRQACDQLAAWDAAGLNPGTMSVNVSTLQFRQPDFAVAVKDALETSGLEPSRLQLEITEPALMKDVEASVRMLRRLAKLGVRIVLDDFGTGYSSLGHLQQLPLHGLKIDRSFVAGLALRGGGPAGGTAPVVETILTLGEKLGLEVVAEGVETRAQMVWLRDAGCDAAQGFLFCKPQPAERVARLLGRAHSQAVLKRGRTDLALEGLLVAG